MENLTILHLENLAGASKQDGKNLANAMRQAVIEFQEDSPYTVSDWDTITYKGFDSDEDGTEDVLDDIKETHYLEVDVHCEHYTTPMIVEFQITATGEGMMMDYYSAI